MNGSAKDEILACGRGSVTPDIRNGALLCLHRMGRSLGEDRAMSGSPFWVFGLMILCLVCVLVMSVMK